MREHDISQASEDVMSEELKLIFEPLWQEAVLLHSRWQEYGILFASGQGRLQILNANCGEIFALLQNALWSETLLQLSRMTDPPRSAGKPNLTLNRLPDLVRADFRSHVEATLQVVEERTKFAREWRNRVLAHTDLDLASGNAAKPLTVADQDKINAALEAIAECLNVVDYLHRNKTTHWKPLSPLNGAETLLYILRAGNRAKDADIASMTGENYDWHSPHRYLSPLP